MLLATADCPSPITAPDDREDKKSTLDYTTFFSFIAECNGTQELVEGKSLRKLERYGWQVTKKRN